MTTEKRIDDIKIQGIYDFGYGIVAKMVMCDNSISIGAKALYAYICTFAGSEKKAWPGRAKICSDLNISKDSFSKYIKELKTRNYIAVQHRKNEKCQFIRNVYIIITQLEDPQQKKPCPEKSDTAQDPKKSQSEPCPKKPCPEKPCPEISDTNINRSFKITSTKKKQRDPDQVIVREPDPDSFSHKPVVVSFRNKSCHKKESNCSKNDDSSFAVGDNFKDVVQTLMKYGVDQNKAEELAGSFSAERIKKVLNYTSSKKPTKTSGYIISALENGWSIPEDMNSQAIDEEKKDLLKERTREILKNLEEARKNSAPLSVQAEHIGAILSRLRCTAAPG